MDAEPIGVRRRKREFALTYAQWETQQLQRALGPDRGRYEPLALGVMLQELDKRQCPACGLERHAESPRCDCGHEFMPPPPPDDPEVATDPASPTFALLMVRNPARFTADAVGFLYWYKGDDLRIPPD